MDQQDAADRVNSVPLSVAERVINVHTTKPYDWVLGNVFSEEKCGKRNKTLFWKSDKPGSCHFFIEFASKDSVPVAQREAGPGVTVHCLSRNMNMAYIFDCLARGLVPPPKKRANTDAEGSQVGDPPDSSKYSISSSVPAPAKRQRIFDNEPARRTSPPPYHRDAPYKSYRQPTTSPLDSRDLPQRNFSYSSKPKPSWNSTVDNRDNSRRYQSSYNSSYQKSRFRNNDFRNSNGSVSPPRRPREDNLYYGERDDDRASSRSRDFSPPRTSFRRASDASIKRSQESSLKRPSDPTLPPSLDAYSPTSPQIPILSQPTIVDNFSFSDLNSLSDDNIAAVIESLKASFSGPEVWMTVAAHYRRMKLHKNALAVVESMLEVMRERGMEKSDLRPALLLMAQCHHSIAKQERREPDTLEASNRHFVLLLDWLRETYGPFTPAIDAIAQSSHRTAWSTEKENFPVLAQNPFEFSQRMSVPEYDPLRPATSLFDTHSSMPARFDAISEENMRLRDSRSATSAELAACRAALLEAESAARTTEAKLQQALDDQRLATTSIAREVDARRRAEDRLAQERKAFERRTDELRDDGARAAMRELSAIIALTAKAPMSMLDATRVFCEARGRVERGAPNTA